MYDLVFKFSGPRKNGPWIVDQIEAGPGCGLLASRGVGIGSTPAEVVAAYAQDFREEASEGTEPTSEECTATFVGYFNEGGIEFKFDPETDLRDPRLGVLTRGEGGEPAVWSFLSAQQTGRMISVDMITITSP